MEKKIIKQRDEKQWIWTTIVNCVQTRRAVGSTSTGEHEKKKTTNETNKISDRQIENLIFFSLLQFALLFI